MSPLLHFVDNQNIFLRFQGVPGKTMYFISWFRLKIIVVGRCTFRPNCRFTDSFVNVSFIYFESSQNLNKNNQKQSPGGVL